MKNKIIIFYALVFTCFFHSSTTHAQDKQKAKISLIKQSGKNVTLSITSPNEFYIGGNTHILYIGDKHFDLNEQNNIDGKGYLKFFIPNEDFKMLKNGSKVYLSYGELNVTSEEEIETMCKQKFSPVWSLGKLNKKRMK